MEEEEKSAKATITLKPAVLENLDKLASDFGLSRSGMITVLVKNRIREDEAMQMSKEFQEALKSAENLKKKSSKA